MCEHFINEFVERTISKLVIYKVDIRRTGYKTIYYFRCSNKKEVLDEMCVKFYEELLLFWEKDISTHYGNFYFGENMKIQFSDWYDGKNTSKLKRVIEKREIYQIAKEHAREMLEVYMKSKSCRIEITELKIE